MLHRIWVVPPRRDADPMISRAHWETEHGALFAKTPRLLHYRQNRPVDAHWAEGTAFCCSETWFADSDAERAGFGSDYYDRTIAPDEALFADRGAAWWAAVDGPIEALPGRASLRLLWFDQNPPATLPWVELTLDRAVPAPGAGHFLYAAEVEDESFSLETARSARGVALVVRSWPIS